MSMRHLHPLSSGRQSRDLTLWLGLVVLLVVVVAASSCRNPRKGYEPPQPIEFSHYVHAGNHQIDCQYCHVSPAAGRHSTVPSVEICMNCHVSIEGRTAQGREDIKTIRESFEKGVPIEWIKVHDMPKFVYFDHQPHIASGLECTNCHGEVNSMAVVGTQNEFNMGWCVNCHRKEEHNAPLNCTTCHR